jgi:hypothetical protein
MNEKNFKTPTSNENPDEKIARDFLLYRWPGAWAKHQERDQKSRRSSRPIFLKAG